MLLSLQASTSHGVGFRERNLWKGGKNHRDPQDIRDRVVYILSLSYIFQFSCKFSMLFSM